MLFARQLKNAFWIIILQFSFFTMAFAQNEDIGCLQCHSGIESIGEAHEDFGCDDCHAGNTDAKDKETAHQGLYINPGDLNIVDETCGMCHDDVVENVKKSLHATSAGVISGARYLWAAQKEKNALYGVREITDEDGEIPLEMSAVHSLQKTPSYEESEQPVDDYLRNQCLRCHLWTDGAKRDGDYRASGCSACHVLYADDGLSHSGDTTIPKDKPGHPVKHQITTKIPANQCIHCHNRGGRTGVSFVGMMESDGYGAPYTADGGKQPKLHGKNYNHLQQDIHFEVGMDCIDCHYSNDLHGDGNIYSKREQAVEIECTDCHGSINALSNLKTSRGTEMGNLRLQNGMVLLEGKISGDDHFVPQLKQLKDDGKLPAAMQIKKHAEKLECYSCHSRWTPQCYGCHAKMDMSQKGYDWVDNVESKTYKWSESRSYLRWETPTLGINSEGKVSPFTTGCQAILTQINEDGNVIELNKVYTTSDGHSGIAHNPIQPHTVSAKARDCENCHASTKAVGLGSGHYNSKMKGLDIDFELERIVDENGNQIQGTSHEGARPFNRSEINNILRVNTCLSCHKDMPTEFWDDVLDEWPKVKNNNEHKNLLNEILKEATE